MSGLISTKGLQETPNLSDFIAEFFKKKQNYLLGPAKTYILRGTPRTCDRQLGN